MDPMQILIIVLVTILTVLLTIVGIQAIFILKELKKTLTRVNSVLDDVETVSHSIATPVERFSGLLMNLQQGAGVLRFLNKIRDRHKEG